jgi:hypothetical protein
VEIKPKVETICHASQWGSSSQPRPLDNASHLLLRIFALGYTYIPKIKHFKQLALLNKQIANIVKTNYDKNKF